MSPRAASTEALRSSPSVRVPGSRRTAIAAPSCEAASVLSFASKAASPSWTITSSRSAQVWRTKSATARSRLANRASRVTVRQLIMALSMEDTAFILTYRENGGGERRDNLLAVLRWLERRPLLEVIVFAQDVAPPVGP